MDLTSPGGSTAAAAGGSAAATLGGSTAVQERRRAVGAAGRPAGARGSAAPGTDGVFAIAAPPPRPPVIDLAGSSTRPARPALPIRCPRWVLEAAVAVVALAVLAVVFAPAAPRSTASDGAASATQRWMAARSGMLVTLARDIAAAHEAAVHRPPAGPAAVSRPVARLREDLAQLRSRGDPPDPAVRRIWTSALGEAATAVTLLSQPRSPTTTQLATAGAALEAAGNTLVAAIQASRPAGNPLPH
ncbi:MAG TPA: hypothetical protein VFN68_05265 [Acidimicrobiales bacterium]|nr:hypothetical protein [Acidimicrobiales bacterium]